MKKERIRANSEPIKLVVPNTIHEKLQAILAVAMSNRKLAEALASVNVDVKIENCTFVDAKTGIQVGYE